MLVLFEVLNKTKSVRNKIRTLFLKDNAINTIGIGALVALVGD